MTINSFKKMKNGKYKLMIDNNEELILYEDIIIKYNLLINKKLNEELLKKINEDNYYYSIYNDALKYISKKMRSRKDITKYLLKKYNNDNTVHEVVKNLVCKNIVNDVEFCKSFVNDKIHLSNYGLDKIKYLLHEHEIEDNVINEITNNIDLDIIRDKLYKQIGKYIKQNKKYSGNVLKGRVINHFTNNGHNKNVIVEIFDSLEIKPDKEVAKREYEKLYAKYSKKYSGYKLENFIKSKLYQKGFSDKDLE